MRSNATGIELLAGTFQNRFLVRDLRGVHRIGVVDRSGEYRPGESSCGPFVSRPVTSPIRISLENNDKIRPQQDGENTFARTRGGGSVL